MILNNNFKKIFFIKFTLKLFIKHTQFSLRNLNMQVYRIHLF